MFMHAVESYHIIQEIEWIFLNIKLFVFKLKTTLFSLEINLVMR